MSDRTMQDKEDRETATTDSDRITVRKETTDRRAARESIFGVRNRVRSILEVVTPPGDRTDSAQAEVPDSAPDYGEKREDRSDRGEEPPGIPEEVTLSDAPGIARIAAGAAWRITEVTVESQVRVSTQLAHAAVSSRSPEELLDESRQIASEELQQLGVEEIADVVAGQHDETTDGAPTEETLRKRGEQLLRQSADIDYNESVHPAYVRILDELAADEARILRLLATEGPQPSVNVRDSGVLPLSSKLVATQLTMIGLEAGCSHEDRMTAYLNNLQRLGLIQFSEEPLDDFSRYQVLEAQPDVVEAREKARRTKIVRHSIHLAPFGVDFCRMCLPVDVNPEEDSDSSESTDDAIK